MENALTILSAVIAVPFIGFLFVLTAKDDEQTRGRNALSVALLAMIANVLLIWRIMVLVDLDKSGLQLVETYRWLENPRIDIVFGVDLFSLLLILALHLAVIIGIIGTGLRGGQTKSMMVWALLFVSMITGLLVSADIFSFYIFFEAMLLPLFMLIGMFGEIKKQPGIFRFFIYNFLGAVFLFIATVVTYHHENHSIALDYVSHIRFNPHLELFVWGAIFISFLSRIPIWPFHYWISSVNAAVRNPLVFIIANLVPLTGVYGFIRFFPRTVPDSAQYFLDILEIISIISMLFIALIGLINKDIQYKLFSYLTVYYIMFMLGALLPTDTILLNIGFSLFAFLIIAALLEVLTLYIEGEQNSKELNAHGILCYVPRLSFIYSFLVLAAVGFPLSSLFLNNFVIFSHLFSYNLQAGIVIMLSTVIVAAAVLQELYVFKDESRVTPEGVCIMDLPVSAFLWLLSAIAVLVVTFINPLWFMGV